MTTEDEKPTQVAEESKVESKGGDGKDNEAVEAGQAGDAGEGAVTEESTANFEPVVSSQIALSTRLRCCYTIVCT